jgi:hypothetical protein
MDINSESASIAPAVVPNPTPVKIVGGLQAHPWQAPTLTVPSHAQHPGLNDRPNDTVSVADLSAVAAGLAPSKV